MFVVTLIRCKDLTLAEKDEFIERLARKEVL